MCVSCNQFISNLSSGKMPKREIAAIYNVPKPRQEWVDGKFVQYSEEDEAWVELFIDLVYVVLLSKLGDIGDHCMEKDSFYGFKLVIIFTIMCLTRQAIDEYANRFYSHDMTHKVIYLVYTLGIFIQVLNINSDADSHHCTYHPQFGFGLSIGILVTRISLILSKYSNPILSIPMLNICLIQIINFVCYFY